MATGTVTDERLRLFGLMEDGALIPYLVAAEGPREDGRNPGRRGQGRRVPPRAGNAQVMPGSRFHARIPSREWARIRRAILTRDGYRCRKCLPARKAGDRSRVHH